MHFSTFSVISGILAMVLMTSVAVSAGLIKRSIAFNQESSEISNNFSGNGKNKPQIDQGGINTATGGVGDNESGDWGNTSGQELGSASALKHCGELGESAKHLDERAICPFEYKENIAEDRIPKVLMEVSAPNDGDKCRKPNSNETTNEGSCKLVYYDVHVQKRVDSNSDKYTACVERIAVARVCASDAV